VDGRGLAGMVSTGCAGVAIGNGIRSWSVGRDVVSMVCVGVAVGNGMTR